MQVSRLADVHLRYTSLHALDYEPGGQLYGVMEGRLEGDRLSGSLHLTNLAVRRPDNVNLPTLRGLLTTGDGAAVWVEIDGLATLRSEDGARVFVARCTFRTGAREYLWLNDAFVVLEGVLDKVAVAGTAEGVMHLCEATLRTADRK